LHQQFLAFNLLDELLNISFKLRGIDVEFAQQRGDDLWAIPRDQVPHLRTDVVEIDIVAAGEIEDNKRRGQKRRRRRRMASAPRCSGVQVA
jgi:hypothetical protein